MTFVPLSQFTHGDPVTVTEGSRHTKKHSLRHKL